MVEGGSDAAPCVPKLSTKDGATSCFSGAVADGLSVLSTANGPTGGFVFLGPHFGFFSGSQPKVVFTSAVPTSPAALLPKQKSLGSKDSMYDCPGASKSARRSGKPEGLIDEGCTNVTVWVPIANEQALRFHELAGFKREPSSAKTVPVGTARVEEIRLKRALT